jgi:hypothetical protein
MTGHLSYAASQSRTADFRARAERTQRIATTSPSPTETRRERRSLPSILRRLRTA